MMDFSCFDQPHLLALIFMHPTHHGLPESSDFLWALCNPGSETALKQEISARGLGWRPSYQEKGFVTFKVATPERPFSRSDLLEPIACARRISLSLGKMADYASVLAAHGQKGEHHLHHVKISRRDSLQHVQVTSGIPAIGDGVLTCVQVESGECWAGLHWHAPYLSPDPGGASCIEMPVNSPSRAWLKIEEARRFWQLEIAPNEIIVELGCAPGGVLLALLERGNGVIGVDPANLADSLRPYLISSRAAAPRIGPWLYHCQRPAALCGKKDLGSGLSWFMSDMNQRPMVVLRECARFCQMCPSIRGVLINLKLSDYAEMLDQQQWLDALRKMGFSQVRMQQMLPHHREFSLLGMR